MMFLWSLCLLAPAAAELPLFAATYNMQQSTMAMPCNLTGMMDMSGDIGKFGIIDFDWSNGKQQWANTHPMSSEELLVTQAIARKNAICPDACPLPDGCPDKAACPQAKTWVYRNFVKALPWYTTVREKLEDPQYAGWFLKFNTKNTSAYSVPQCDVNFTPPKCTALYHDQKQTPQYPGQKISDGKCTEACDCGDVPCGEYLFDHRNASLTAWLLGEYTNGATGLANPNIDGFFIDDVWSPRGPSEEGPNSVIDMGLSAAEVSAIAKGWKNNMKQVKKLILDKNGFNWQMFDIGANTNAKAPFDKDQCTEYMRSTACKADSVLQNQSMMYGFTDQSQTSTPYFTQDLAAFLLIRGPYAWLGYSWRGCNGDTGGEIEYQFPDALGEDYGEPVGVCEETAVGSEVFVRKWTKASVTLDCKNWQGNVTLI